VVLENTMKISQSPDNPVVVSSNAANLAAKSGAMATAAVKTSVSKGPQSAGVAVTVSTLARSLEAAEKNETSDVDMGKVDAVRTAISKGTYVVNPEAIADKLLSNAQEMLPRKRV
jgi:negative regulator of flagellin synthesis FlgM